MSNRRQQAKRRETNRPVFCESKKTPWATRKQALGSAAVTAKATGKPMDTYKCWLCGRWHITSSIPQAPRPAQRPQAFA